MKKVDRLFYVAPGNWNIEEPKPGETVDQLYKRLERRARSYREYGRAFRVEKLANGVLWWRVEPGEHTKLARWYRLPFGETMSLGEAVSDKETEAAKATARYLRRKGAGAFAVRRECGRLLVTRLTDQAPQA